MKVICYLPHVMAVQTHLTQAQTLEKPKHVILNEAKVQFLSSKHFIDLQLIEGP